MNKKPIKIISLLLLFVLVLGACAPKTKVEKPLKTVSVTNDQLADKIKGAWAGQMAGVVLGAKQEFWYPGTMMPDDQVEDFSTLDINHAFWQDDLYVEITYIEQMLKTGYNSTLKQMADAFRDSTYWLDHANKKGRENLQNGIEAPDSGNYKYNLHCDDIDWQINADFVGQMYPGNPTAAAARAFELGHITNYGDGVYGGVFVAAMYAAAFTADSVDEIIQAGYDAIPEGTKFKAILDDLISAHKEGKAWKEAWQIINDKWCHDDRCSTFGNIVSNIDAKLNSAYILMGLLYGEGDYINSMVISMQCGQDSDCNPSSVGGILGAYYGFSNIPEKCVNGLDEVNTKFYETNLSFKETVDATVKLMGDSIKTYAKSIKNGYSINVYNTEPVAYEQWPDMPTVDLTATVGDDSTVLVNLTVVAKDGVKSIKVDMGDGNVLYDTIATYQYAKAGTYTITATVVNNNGNSAQASATVTTTIDVNMDNDDNQGEYRNIASNGHIVCTVTNPFGSGSKTLETIRDGIVPPVGAWALEMQYDTYCNNLLAHEERVGYLFLQEYEIDKVVFVEGMHFDNGGWFDDGSLKLQVLVVDGDIAEWKDVDVKSSPVYPNGNTQTAFGSAFESYTFNIEKTKCVGVRLVGMAGGGARFISIAELEVYGVEA